MTTQHFSHAESAHPTAPQVPSAAPKLHVQRSLSREAITIHFSPLGKEEEGEEEEEELYASNVSAARRDSNVVTALEAREEMPEEGLLDSAAGGAAVPASSASLPSLPDHRSTTTHAPSLSLFPNEKKLADSSTFSPTKSVSLPSIDKPSLGMTKSHSSDVEPRNAASSAVPLLVRHRHLMKTLVKSLSSDTSQESSSSTSRISDSRLNLQLFKQFTQSRMPTAAASSAADSKTAPSSPLTSPESRNFFKVSEVEACIEDTKRRLSEAIYEPLQMLSKIMDEKNIVGSVASYRAKPFSVSASELSNMASLGHLESNNNSYCIKEEEEGGDCESDSPNWAPCQAESPCTSSADTKSPKKPVASSMSLDKCSMSALAKLEDEDFCILHNEDFDSCTDIGGDHGDRTDYACGSTKVAASEGTEPCSEDELEIGEPAPTVPFYTLLIITALVYGYFVLPLPTYIGGMLLGVGLGFFIAIAVVWLAGPKPSGHGFKHFGHFRNTAEFTIEEPAIFKGWMNEIMTYDPETYHATLTHSIYVRLEGSILRLSKPNRNVTRRATHNEAKPEVTYISQKIYDLTDSKVYLMPENLARKRVWNKKYPICIELGKQDDFMSKVEGELSDVGKELSTSTTVQGEKGAGSGATQGRRRTSSSSRCLTLHLFGRTGREKEEWFRRILLASKGKGQMKSTSKNALSSLRPSSSQNSLDEALAKSKDSLAASSGSIKTKSLLDYGAYMATLMPTQASPDTASPALQTPQSSPEATKKLPPSPPARPPDEEQPVAWLNAAVGRVLWDFLGEPHWAKMVSKKIQMKLSKIRLPYFMNELTLTELDMGMATPRILGASQPSIDHQGLWFDLDISYSGSFLMTLETKMNLIRLGKEEEAPRFESGKDGYRPRSYCLADSDEESSSAGSSDEEDPSELTPDSTVDGFVGGHKPSKIMKFVDKITKSKYFQKATETEFIKKKMEEVSNTPLLLTVEVQELQGTLAVNIPPPPTDRIWYGFRTPPHVELKARPKLGEREVTFAHVTDWIEKKLYQEFQKIFVMPNMDDLWLTIMHSAMDPRTSGGPLVLPATNPLPSQQAMGATKQQ